MLKEAYCSGSVFSDVKHGRVKLPDNYIPVCREQGNDELTPSKDLYWHFDSVRRDLFRENNLLGMDIELPVDIELEAQLHNQAFVYVEYPTRFRQQILNDPEAMKKLKAIVERSKVEDVYLVCYEGWGKACHRRILLNICREQYNAEVEIQGIVL